MRQALLLCVLLVAQTHGFLHLPSAQHRRCAAIRLCAADEKESAQLVWLTGSQDLRLHDHGGFTVASATEGGGAVVPLFIIDPEVHLRYTPARLERVHKALSSLEASLKAEFDVPLIVRRGNPEVVLAQVAQECGATTAHVIADDTERNMRAAQRSGCAALQSAGVRVQRWDNALRAAAWTADAAKLPSTFPEYAGTSSSLTLQAPLGAPEEMAFLIDALPTEGVPPLPQLLEERSDLEASLTPGVAAARAGGPATATVQPFEAVALAQCDEAVARATLARYVSEGRDAIADALFVRAADGAQQPSLHSAAHQRLIDGGKPSEVFALREAPTRLFAPALSVGTVCCLAS